MSGVLNKLKEGVYIDNNGKKHNVKEMYYISAGNKFRIWPQDTWAEKVELRRLDDAGYEITRYEVQQSSELDTTYYIDINGNKLTGLPPGKYAMVATIVHSSLEIIDGRATDCWCTHLTSSGPSSGNQIRFSSGGSFGFNIENQTKYNPFTGTRHSYSVIEILNGDIGVEQIQCPFMYYSVRETYNGVEGFIVGAIPGSNTAPLRIVREKPTHGFVLGKVGSSNNIENNTTLTESISILPRYKIYWSSGTDSNVATASTSGNYFDLTKKSTWYELNLHTFPTLGNSASQTITLKWGEFSTTYTFDIATKDYYIQMNNNAIYNGHTYTLNADCDVQLFEWLNHGVSEITDFTMTSSNSNVVGVYKKMLIKSGPGTCTISVYYNNNKNPVMSFEVTVEGKTLYFKIEYTTDGTTWLPGYQSHVDQGQGGATVLPVGPSGPDFSTIKYRIIFTDESWTNKKYYLVYPPNSVKSGWPSSSGYMNEISGPYDWNNHSTYIYWVDTDHPNLGFKLEIYC